jgi:hypothetical protein
VNEVWEPIAVEELIKILKNSRAPYWIAGGLAIDLFLGKTTRKHDDLDVAICRKDQLFFQNILATWDLKASDPPGSGRLRNWESNEILSSSVHNIWCRKSENESWSLELLLSDFENDEWVYRRNPAIRGRVGKFGWTTSSGIAVVSPEIQMLYKSRNPREKDILDFEHCLNAFSTVQRVWLREALLVDSGPSHPWLKWL